MSDADTAAAAERPRRSGPRRRQPQQGQTYGFATLFKDSAIYGAGRWLQKFLSMLLLPLYTSYLTPFDYGILGLILTTQTMIDVIVTFGWDVTFSRFYFDDKSEEHRRKVITHTFYVDTVYPLVVLGLLAVVMPWLAKLIVGGGDWQPRFTFWFDLSLVTLFFTNINDLPFQLFRLDHRPWRFFSFTMGRLFLQIPVTVVLVAVLHWGVLGVLIGNLAAAVVLNLASLPFYVGRLHFTWDALLFVEMIGFAGANFVANIAFFLLNFSNRYMLRLFGSVTEVGLYTAAFMLAQPVYFAGYAFRLAWPQWHYSFLHDPEKHKLRVARGYTYFAFVSAALIAGIAVFLPLMMRVLLRNPDFWSVGQTTLVLLVGMTIFNSYHLFLVGVNVTKNNKLLPVLVAIAAIVSIGLNVLLIRAFGTLGAAYSTLLSFALLAVMMRQLSQHYYPIPHEWSRVARLALAAALAVSAAWGLGRMTGLTVGMPMGALIVRQALCVPALALFPLTLWATHFFTPAEATALKRGVGRRLHRRRPTGVVTPRLESADDVAVRLTEPELAEEEELSEEDWSGGLKDDDGTGL